MNRLDFAGLIASRLCHDLSSPIGAITAGAELIADETDETARAEIATLIGASAAVLTDRLRFYRLLFAGASDAPFADAEAREVLTHYLSGNAQVRVEWPSIGLPQPRSMARLLLALAVTAADAIERSGTIAIQFHEDGWRVRASGPVVRLPPGHGIAIAGREPAEARPRAAIALFAAALAEAAGAVIIIGQSNILTFSIQQR